MPASIVAEFTVLKPRPEAPLDEAGSATEKTWQEVSSGIGAVAKSQYFGRQLENPDAGVYVTIWPSLADADAFKASQARDALSQKLSSVTAPGPVTRHTVTLQAEDEDAAEAVFRAPVTEIFTGYGAEEPFLGNVTRFAQLVANEGPDGLSGLVVGQSVRDDVVREEGAESGRAVKLLVGWESREKHLEAKARPGAIRDEINLVRAGRKEGEMYHVRFTKL